MFPTYWHLAAFFGSIPNGSVATAVPTITDQVLTQNSATTYVIPQSGKLEAIYSAGASLAEAQINTPSLRYVGLPFVGFLNTALVVPTPPNWSYWGENGPTIPPVDTLSVIHTQGGAGAENEFSLFWLRYQRVPVPTLPTYRLEFTSTITGVTGAWASGALAPTTTLPQGTYNVVGMDCVGANLAAARLIFPGSIYRPGVLARNTKSALPLPHFTDGRMGMYGAFKSINLPNLEILVSGANTAQTTYLDIQRTGDWTP